MTLTVSTFLSPSPWDAQELVCNNYCTDASFINKVGSVLRELKEVKIK